MSLLENQPIEPDTTPLCECGSFSDHASDLEVIRHDVWEMKQVVEKVGVLLKEINDQVEPALEAVANSPLGNMLGLSGGKR
jgi:hypothetical protein